jgi:hypothetical protein
MIQKQNNYRDKCVFKAYKCAKCKQYKDIMIVTRYMPVSLWQLMYIIKVDADDPGSNP